MTGALDTFEAFAAYLRILSFRGTAPNSNVMVLNGQHEHHRGISNMWTASPTSKSSYPKRSAKICPISRATRVRIHEINQTGLFRLAEQRG